eukprot:275329_1
MLPSQLRKTAMANHTDSPVSYTNSCVPVVNYWKMLLLMIIWVLFIQIYYEYDFQYSYDLPPARIIPLVETQTNLCLYDTENSLNKSILSIGVGNNGYWVNISNDGNLLTQYDFYADTVAVYRYNDHCVYHIYGILDDNLLQCLSNRPLLFLGDSTMEYMVYYGLLNLLLNVSLFEDEAHIQREFEFSEQFFLGKYNISIYYRYTSGWPSIYNNHGTTTFSHRHLWGYIDKRFLNFGNITHVIFHSLFHDITHRTIYEREQHHRNISLQDHVEQYKQRLVKIYIGLLDRIALKAKLNRDLNDNDYMLYIWPSTHAGNSGDMKGLIFLFGHEGYYEWFNDYYDYYLYGMIEAISDAIELHPKYKQHLIFIDTSSMSKDHRNMYYGDGLHYGSGQQRDGIKRSPVVRNMMANAVLNEICLRS